MNKMMNMYTYMGPDSQAKKRKLTKLTSLNPGIYNQSIFFITGVLVSKVGKNEISIHSILNTTTINALRLKFIYSEKVTKFCEIFTLLLSYVVPVK